jgi:hypothetical protein
LPPAAAAIVAVPALKPITIPDAPTDATAGADVVQRNVCPVSGCPLVSQAVAVSCSDVVTAMLAAGGETDTAATAEGAGSAGPRPVRSS